METFGDRLRRLRTQKGLSLDELAAATGISKAYLWKLERKPDVNPSIEIAQKLAAALGTTVGTLVPAAAGRDTGRSEIPESLKEAKRLFRMSEQDVQDLADIRFRGGHPMTSEEWGLLYLQLKQIVEGGST
ncbi:MAG: helix-turn-helix transcriptional regulator [bacterium]|nr:helix-turn-helix transcriptional regulator [bacterium]